MVVVIQNLPLDMISLRRLVPNRQDVREKAVTIQKVRLSDMISLRQPVRNQQRCQREGCDYTEGKALGHDISKATCTEAAKCQREGCHYTEGKPLGHDMNAWTVTKKSTTTEKGERARNCKRCDYRETELIERLSRKADAGKNQIADLRTDINYPLDETITFHLYGAGQDNTEPVEGDTRYVPESWKIENQFDWRETDGESRFQIHKAGFYKVMASFRQQKFESGTWQNTDQTDIKEVTIKAGTEAQREEQARKDAAKKAAKTGDTSQMFSLYSSSACGSRTCSICDCSK